MGNLFSIWFYGDVGLFTAGADRRMQPNSGLILWLNFSGLLGKSMLRLCHSIVWFYRHLGYGFRTKWMNPNMKSTLKLMLSRLGQLQLSTSRLVSPWVICTGLCVCVCACGSMRVDGCVHIHFFLCSNSLLYCKKTV